MAIGMIDMMAIGIAIWSGAGRLDGTSELGNRLHRGGDWSHRIKRFREREQKDESLSRILWEEHNGKELEPGGLGWSPDCHLQAVWPWAGNTISLCSLFSSLRWGKYRYPPHRPIVRTEWVNTYKVHSECSKMLLVIHILGTGQRKWRGGREKGKRGREKVGSVPGHIIIKEERVSNRKPVKMNMNKSLDWTIRNILGIFDNAVWTGWWGKKP